LEALTIQNLTVKLKNFVLGPINLELEEHGYYVIAGPNGSGKTTLLRSILGFYRPLYGKIILYGKDITNLPIEKRKIGYVTQSYSLFNNMDAKSNIEYGLKLMKLNKSEREKRIKDISVMLNIENLLNKKPKELSGGQQQLISIARALVIEPKILLLDEPLSNLDPNVKKNLRNILKKITKLKTTTIIHVSHFIEDAFELSTKLFFMYKGKIIEAGNPVEIINNPKTLEFSEYLGYSNMIDTNSFGILENIFHDLKRLDYDGKVYAVFRPEDAKICGNKCCDYNFEGKIIDISLTSRGFLYIVKVNDKTFNIFSEDKFEENSKVYLCFDANKIKIVRSANANEI
jgi:ABC-type Fe3+/spermidine/putrescine transport system ATPase subunit